MKKNFFVLFYFVISNVFSNTLWQKISSENIKIEGIRKIIPQKYNLLQLNNAAFQLFQQSIPKEQSRQSVIIDLPTPEGDFIKFKIFELPCMDPILAAKFPTIKTYQALCVDNPAITAKLDYTSFGFHAMVFSPKGVYFIDPFSTSNTGYYTCYYKKDYSKISNSNTACQTGIIENTLAHSSQRITQTTNGIVNSIATGVRRNYRLALACTREYSIAVCAPSAPTKTLVLSAMITTLNRVNGVYEKDLSVHMDLIANNDTLIFIGTDNYSNDDGGAMLDQNQTVCDARIGNANYDIGHVFSTGGGGVAYLASVCDNQIKAKGVTGSSEPIGDGFDIDYVAHEMGHQFGANHTFNGNTGACNGNRNSTTAYEPGSGITIMGYAGICDANDIQAHSDDFFHRASIVEIFNHISSTSCAMISNTGNQAPNVLSYKSTYYIPYKTSFEVTATASDPNGFPLNYLWEEWDLGPAGSWSNANIITAPILRSFSPTPSPTRTFPRWDSLINNVIRYKGEVLPEVARDVKLRCTVKNIDPNGYGAFNAPDSNITVKSIATPTLFRVTSHAAPSIITGNTTITVNWDIANTTAAPISCANVQIYLSLDSARTFPYLLATTSNDGSEVINIPDVVTDNASARIKVKGAGNIFFDLNNGWIKINQGVPIVQASFSASDSVICQGENILFSNTTTGNPDSVKWTIHGGLPDTSTSLTSFNAQFDSSGIYMVSLVAYKNGNASNVFVKNITVHPNPLIVFSPTSPNICSGDSIALSVAYIAGATCIWSNLSTNDTISVAPTQDTYYSISITNNECTSVDSVLVKVNPTKTTNIANTICSDDSVVIGNQVFKTTGIHSVVMQTSQGCDSTVVLDLTVHSTKTTNIASTICSDDSVIIGNQVFKTTGIHSVVMQTSQGCDSTVVLDLTVHSTKTTNIASTICSDDSVIIGNQIFKTSGTHSVVMQTAQGCDSTIVLDLTVHDVPIQAVITQSHDTLFCNVIMAGATYNWLQSNNIDTLTNEPYLIIRNSGAYAVQVHSVDNCTSDTSDYFNAILTAIKSTKTSTSFSVSPNPNNGSFLVYISSVKSALLQLKLYSITGQILKQETISTLQGNTIFPINMQGIEKGMYFISLYNEDGVATQNIIIQ
ncbi:MAG TPA: zinc-dependent metalloprotease family protein [Chitinophagales bacterium]|nr:zinc-dependent metalloprotease family protein [Chitinophagales bacterium]